VPDASCRKMCVRWAARGGRGGVELASVGGGDGAAIGTKNLDTRLGALDIYDGGFVDFGKMIGGSGIGDEFGRWGGQYI
jgi:hypothetical protein